MNGRIGWIVFGLGCLIAGCATTLVREEPEAIGVGPARVTCATAPLAEALLTRRGTSVRNLTGSWRTRTFAAECVTKGEAGRFTAVFLAPHMRLATLVVTPPHTVSFDRARTVPEAFKPEYALFDLAVIELPLPVLRRALGASFTVRETPEERLVSARGEPVARVTRPSSGTVRYENLTFGYTYDIRTQPAAEDSP